MFQEHNMCFRKDFKQLRKAESSSKEFYSTGIACRNRNGGELGFYKCNTSLYFLSIIACGRATKALELPRHRSHERPHGSAPTNMHNMVRAQNHHKDVGSVDKFPPGLRVLIVDEDPICLMILERMLHQCSYTGFASMPILTFHVSWGKIRVLNLMVNELICIQHNEVSTIVVDFFLYICFVLYCQMFTLSLATLTSFVQSLRMDIKGWTRL
jgi:hypothetical protein